MHARLMFAAALGSAAASDAVAQSLPSIGVEATTDDRRRGISWSDGKPTLAASARMDIPGGIDVGVRVSGTREDPRHGGAGAVVDPSIGYSWQAGGFRLDGFVLGHFFAGADGGMDYGEGGVSAAYTLGPAEVGVEARYAPAQHAIGGDNLYLGARARVGIPLTPLSFTGSVGRSSGSVDDPIRAERLRPQGSYADWSLGVEHTTGPFTLGLLYTGTDIDTRRESPSPYANLRDAGDRLSARASISF